MKSLEAQTREFYAILDSQDWDKLNTVISEDAIIQVGGSPPVKFVQAQNLRALYGAFPDGHHLIDDCLIENDRCVTRCRFEGTHTGNFRDVKPTGTRISFTVVHIDRFRDGKLVEHFGQPDMLGLMRQIGAVR